MKGGITVELAYKAVLAALQGAGGDNPESAATALGFPTGWKATCWLEKANGRKRIKFSGPIGLPIHSVTALCVEFPDGLPSGLQEEKAKEWAASLALGAPDKLPSQRAKGFISMDLAYEVVSAAIESSGGNSEGAAQLLGFPAGWKARRWVEVSRGSKRFKFIPPQSGTHYHSLKALSDSGELPNGLPSGLQEEGAKELISKGSLELQSETSVPSGLQENALTQIATKELAAKHPEPTRKEPESEETVPKQVAPTDFAAKQIAPKERVAKQHLPTDQESASKEVAPKVISPKQLAATKIAPKELAVRAPLVKGSASLATDSVANVPVPKVFVEQRQRHEKRQTVEKREAKILVSAPPAKRQRRMTSSSSSSSDSSSSSPSAKASQKVASGSMTTADIVPEQVHEASPNAAGTTSSGNVASTAAQPESLWYKSFDAAHGLPYWYHRQTKESVWERPAGAPP